MFVHSALEDAVVCVARIVIEQTCGKCEYFVPGRRGFAQSSHLESRNSLRSGRTRPQPDSDFTAIRRKSAQERTLPAHRWRLQEILQQSVQSVIGTSATIGSLARCYQLSCILRTNQWR